MASAQGEGLSRAVHVPSCLSEDCKTHMDRLVSSLQERGIPSVYEARGDYKPGGKYATRFAKYFQECRRTVIHICPKNLRKVLQVKDVLSKDPEKACFVHLPCSLDYYPDFVEEFNVLNLCDETAHSRFIDDMVNEDDVTQPARAKTPPIPCPRKPRPAQWTPDRSPTDPVTDIEYNMEASGFSQVHMIHRGAEYPIVHLHESVVAALDSCSIRCTEISQDDCVKIAQSSSLTPCSLFSLLHMIIPDLYNQRQIIHLAHLAGSRQPQLRGRSLRFIQFLLLDQNPLPFSQKALEETECSLFNLVADLKTTQEQSHLDNALVTYLMTLVSYVIASHTEGQDEECDRYLAVIKERQLFKKTKGTGVLASSMWRQKSWVRVLHQCICQWLKRKCSCLNSILSCVASSRGETIENHTQPCPAEIQLFILISSLFQLHRTCDLPTFFRHLSHFSPKSKAKVQMGLISSVRICGLTSFVERKAGDLTSTSNFPENCKEVENVLRKAFLLLGERERPQFLEELTALAFHNKKNIRMEFFGLYRNLSVGQRSFVDPIRFLWDSLLLITQNLLWPLVKNVEGTNSPHWEPESMRRGWVVARHHFGSNNHHVLVHLLLPTFTEYVEKCRCSLRDERFNELRLLKELQHPHIVQMLAFNENCWPQFYVTEDYLTHSFQTRLVNKSRHNDHFTVRELFTFLIDAVEAVQFLHDKNVVHRNLTAASFFISASGQIKLSELMQARKLSGETVRDYECSFIPTRWTAPESLKNCQFSKTSDMWMVGHFIYEVLTHGRLPYADVRTDDTELMPVVVAGRRTLCEDACIPSPVHLVIVQLTHVDSASRPADLKDVIEVLRTLAGSITEDQASVTFPDIRAKGQAATEHNKGPVFTVLDTYFGEPVTCRMAEEDEGYANLDLPNTVPRNNNGVHRGLIPFTELCPADFSSDVWSLLTEGLLPGIPTLISQPKSNSEGKLQISLAIPAKYGLCSLKTAVINKWLGIHIKVYVECLQKIATSIAHLHSRGLVLCDFDADTIYIENTSNTSAQIKVWFTSIAKIRRLPCAVETDIGSKHVQLAAPRKSEALRRAAPEVVKQGLYSHASDVFCFGRLMWWVFNTFCRAGSGESVSGRTLDLFGDIPDSEIYQRISDVNTVLLEKPPVCPVHIYNQMKKCWNPRSYERPQMEELQQHITLSEDTVGTSVSGLLSIVNPSPEGTLSEEDEIISSPGVYENDLNTYEECSYTAYESSHDRVPPRFPASDRFDNQECSTSLKVAYRHSTERPNRQDSESYDYLPAEPHSYINISSSQSAPGRAQGWESSRGPALWTQQFSPPRASPDFRPPLPPRRTSVVPPPLPPRPPGLRLQTPGEESPSVPPPLPYRVDGCYLTPTTEPLEPPRAHGNRVRMGDATIHRSYCFNFV